MSRLSIYLALTFVVALLVAAAHPGRSFQGKELLSAAPEEITTGSISRDRD
ncbi:hypothetical protein M1D80_10675 [Phyllobacteriaceae bacterium JZ32]